MEERRPNRLIDATSPYLRQHAYNPVNWYPWGAEALEIARRQDKPIFLSIGYSTCHWCHVMAHESFENPAIAAIMNEHFVCIKLDREERPDLDETYMSAVQILTGNGGWPLSIFLTPELKPFYGGTYFPPEDRAGLPGFSRLLLALSQAYHQNRGQIDTLSEKVLDHLKRLGEAPRSAGEPTWEMVQQAAATVGKDFDPVNGGLGTAPKFPRSLELDFLLHYHRFGGEAALRQKLAFTLEKMARGGIYDQLGGGFHRYSVDAAWVVPHFEKMLYDNALLPPLYLALFQLTGDSLARRVATETLNCLLRDFAAPQGGFYAAWDADSEGEEGKFYVWSKKEVETVVGPAAAALVTAAFGVTEQGNFEGSNILTRPRPLGELAADFSLSAAAAAALLAEAAARLLEQRATRVPPHRDEKILVAWNGLAISALARGAQVLSDRRYYEAAAAAARFITSELLQENLLFRVWAAGKISVPGFSEDYSHLAQALLDLYETDFDPAWITLARRLMDLMEEKFLDRESGTYFYVAAHEESPLVRSRGLYDQTLPSGNSMAARVCLKLYRLTEEPRYLERAQHILRQLQGSARENPWAFSHFWTAAALYLVPPLDLTFVGDPADNRLGELLQTAYRFYLPERRLIRKDPVEAATLEEAIPAAKGYYLLGEQPVAYLCHHFSCLPEIADAGELGEKLAQVKAGLQETGVVRDAEK